MAAYYNEHDREAAAWLRELVKEGLIAPGDVDERDIRDVRPDDLRGYTQHHFFAGIGTWSYALRRAGWSDDRPVWTGSPPCQPFSAPGRREGFADERHLWPHFFHLIGIESPRVLFGEQVASKDGLAWLDLVQADMEGAGYACGAFDLCAAGFGAPHIRQRQYIVAHDARRMADSQCAGLQGYTGHGDRETGRTFADRSVTEAGAIGGVEYPNGGQFGEAGSIQSGGEYRLQPEDGSAVRTQDQRARAEFDRDARKERPGQTNGFWGIADWLFCRDGKWRPVEPGSFPLADGVAGRMGLLRGYGNGIVAEQAQAVIETYLEAEAAGFDAGTGMGDCCINEMLS